MGPGLLLLGAVLGQCLLRDTGVSIWTEGETRTSDVAPAQDPLPSLAPIVRRVRAGVVGIRTIRRVPSDDASPTSSN
jgi:hypothetical protein